MSVVRFLSSQKLGEATLEDVVQAKMGEGIWKKILVTISRGLIRILFTDKKVLKNT